MAKKKILGILEYFNIGDLSKNKKREQKRIFFLQKRKLRPEPQFLTCHRRPAGAKNCQ